MIPRLHIILAAALTMAAPPRAAFGEEHLTFTQLERILRDNPVATIDEFLPLLPASFRSRFTLLHSPESKAQSGSFERPRAVLFTPDGKLVISFNGDPSHAGYNKIEILHFNDEKRGFEAAEIAFPEGKDYEPGGRYAYKPRTPVLTRNPTRCTNCHTKAMLPKWDPYNHWPGAYGSEDDLRFNGRPYSEEAGLAKLDKERGELSRYRHLIVEQPSLMAHFTRTQPNSRLTTALYSANAARLAQQMKELPDYHKYKYALLAATLDVENVHAFVPVHHRAFSVPYTQYRAQAYLDARRVEKRASQRQEEIRQPEFSHHAIYSPHRETAYDDNVHRVTKLRYLVEGVLGGDMSDWAITVHPSYQFIDGNSDVDLISRELAKQIVADDPSLKPFLEFMESSKFNTLNLLLGRYRGTYSTKDEVAMVGEWRKAMDELKARSHRAVGGIYLPDCLTPLKRFGLDASRWTLGL